MARSKSGYSTPSNYGTGKSYRQTRVTVANATQRVRPVVLPRYVTTFTPILLEDRRTFHPDGPKRAPQAVYRSDTQLVPKGGSSGRKSSKAALRASFYDAPPQSVGFKRPDRVAICIRRKARRQILFAAGVGGKRVRPGKRTYKSGFHCN